MHTQRDELAEVIRSKIQKGLDSSDPGVFTVTTVNVKSLVTDSNMEKSIRDQVALDQQIAAELKQQQLAKERNETKRLAAEGDARANRIVAESITSNLLALKQIDAQREIGITQGNTTIMMPYGQPSIVNLK